MSLHGKVALVTGAGTGIGKGIAVELAKRGAKVIVHYHSSSGGALDTQRLIESLNGESIIIQADVGHREEIVKLTETAAEAFGGIDILVNNAALQLNLGLFEYSDAEYDRVMSVNLKGYWQCIQAVVPFMKAKGSGRIVNISSVHGKRPSDFDTVYAMTKGGIKMLTRESAIELGRYGITVNTIEPGAVDVGVKSGMPRPIVPPDVAIESSPDDFTKKFPLGRVGLPKDIGHMVCWLVSDEGEFVTGASIRMDGASMLL